MIGTSQYANCETRKNLLSSSLLTNHSFRKQQSKLSRQVAEVEG